MLLPKRNRIQIQPRILTPTRLRRSMIKVNMEPRSPILIPSRQHGNAPTIRRIRRRIIEIQIQPPSPIIDRTSIKRPIGIRLGRVPPQFAACSPDCAWNAVVPGIVGYRVEFADCGFHEDFASVREPVVVCHVHGWVREGELRV